jgi:hypothetical protein
MNTTHNTKTKRVAALGAAAAAVMAPALLFAGAGTAHAGCYDSSDIAGSYYCSPAGGGVGSQTSEEPEYHPTPLSPTGQDLIDRCYGALGAMFHMGACGD